MSSLFCEKGPSNMPLGSSITLFWMSLNEPSSTLPLPRMSAMMSPLFAEATISLSARLSFKLLRYIYSRLDICHSSSSPPAATVYSILCALSPILFKKLAISSVRVISRGRRSSTTSAISLSIAMSASTLARSVEEVDTLAFERLESRLSTIELSS